MRTAFLIWWVYIQVAADWLTPLTHQSNRVNVPQKPMHTISHCCEETYHSTQVKGMYCMYILKAFHVHIYNKPIIIADLKPMSKSRKCKMRFTTKFKSLNGVGKYITIVIRSKSLSITCQ